MIFAKYALRRPFFSIRIRLNPFVDRAKFWAVSEGFKNQLLTKSARMFCVYTPLEHFYGLRKSLQNFVAVFGKFETNGNPKGFCNGFRKTATNFFYGIRKPLQNFVAGFPNGLRRIRMRKKGGEARILRIYLCTHLQNNGTPAAVLLKIFLITFGQT